MKFATLMLGMRHRLTVRNERGVGGEGCAGEEAGGHVQVERLQIPPEPDRVKPVTEEAKRAEQERLRPFAKVTPDEAKAAGMAAYDGEFKYVKLHNYDDLVYEVEFADGLELSVDAGNRAILRVKFEKGSVLWRLCKRAAKKVWWPNCPRRRRSDD